MKELYLAGGPYYGLQEVFSRVQGVVDARAGFANSVIENPTKDDVESGRAQAVECVKVIYNPKKIDITSLLEVFFTVINPYTDGIQGKCEGPHYRSGVYFTSGEDSMQLGYYMSYMANRGNARQMTEASFVFNEFEGERRARPPVRTECRRLDNFYEAPEEEQHYLRKHPETYSPIDIKLLEESGVFGPQE